MEDSEDPSDSQINDNDQGGDSEQDEQDEQDEESVKTITDPTPPTKRKSPEVAEVTKPQPRKKVKASKDKDIEEEASVTMSALEHALEQSTLVLTKKWSEFAELHLASLAGLATRVSELKELIAKPAPSTVASSTMATPQ